MRILLTFNTASKPRRKTAVVIATLPTESVNLTMLKEFVVFEQFFNQIEGNDTKLKVDLEQ